MSEKDFQNEISNVLGNLCGFDYKNTIERKRQFAVIGCSIGPKSDDTEIMTKMIRAGMNIARFNMSHGTREECSENIRKFRSAILKNNETSEIIEQVAIALDLSGPEIRTGMFANPIHEIKVNKNDLIKLTSLEAYSKRCSQDLIYINYPQLPFIIKKNTKIFLDEGRVILCVKEIISDIVHCIVENSGILSSNTIVHLHNTPIQLPLVSNKDKNDMKFAIEQNVDIIIASNVQNSEQILKIRNYLGKKGSHIQILAKINYFISKNLLNDIINVSDGIIISRGYSYLIVPLQQSFLIQKAVVEKCKKVSKPVLISGRFFGSLINKAYPSESEISDVVNTILCDVDGIFLLQETSKGNYPVNAVKELINAVKEAEIVLWNQNIRILRDSSKFKHISHLDLFQAIIISSVDISNLIKATAIICITKTGNTAILLSLYRPNCVIFAVTRCERTAKKLIVYRSIYPLLVTGPINSDWHKEINKQLKTTLLTGKKLRILKEDDFVVLINEWRKSTGFSDTMRIIKVKFDEDNDYDYDIDTQFSVAF